jgi:predicted AlkP superfamily pyrophosphatase or phosphodiesterase
VNRLATFVLCAGLATLAPIPARLHAPGQTSAAAAPVVVVISLDGFPAYALDDPRLPIPTLRTLAREGVAAAGMQPINPTVTWPNHTAMVTGVDASRHQVLYNGLLTHPGGGALPKVEMWRDKEQMVHAPTVYDLAYQAGLITAQVDWVAIYHAKTITWQFPELPDPNGAIEREMIAAGTVTADQLRTFEDSSQAWQDRMWTDAAQVILEKHQPNLLLFHLLCLDNINHEYGPMSAASFTAMAFLDDRVKQILDTLQRSGVAGRATVIVVSDHGFRNVAHKIHPNALLHEKGLLRGEPGEPKDSAYLITDGGIANVYVANPDNRAEAISHLRGMFSSAEGIDHVYGTEDFAKLGLPVPGQSDQAPDLVLAAKDDYSFQGESEGDYITDSRERGTHGYLNTDPKMQAIFIAWGAGIPKGVRLGNISNLDVAPTVAELLGLEMHNVQGHPIPQIIRHNVSP